MSKPLTQGEKNRRANIRVMKALGAKNAKLRTAAKVERFLGHVDAMNQRSVDADAARAARRAEGVAKRDAHNAGLRADKIRTLAGELLVLAQASEITSAGAQSPVTANVYAIDARHNRTAANDLLAGIGLTANDIDVDGLVDSILARAA